MTAQLNIHSHEMLIKEKLGLLEWIKNNNQAQGALSNHWFRDRKCQEHLQDQSFKLQQSFVFEEKNKEQTNRLFCSKI